MLQKLVVYRITAFFEPLTLPLETACSLHCGDDHKYKVLTIHLWPTMVLTRLLMFNMHSQKIKFGNCPAIYLY